MINTPSIEIPVSKPKVHYLNFSYDIKSWLLTTDHKRVAVLYLATLPLFFGLGGALALVMQAELATAPADIFDADIYNRLFTLHGIMMTFFFLVPALFAVFGGFLVPLMIGARRVAFPRLYLASWYVYLLGGLLLGGVISVGGIDTGWNFVTPYATNFSEGAVPFMLKLLGILSPLSTIHGGFTLLAAVLALLITGFSAIMVAVNMIATIHRLRAPGLTWNRLPLFVWSVYAAGVVVLLGTPALVFVVTMLSLATLTSMGLVSMGFKGNFLLIQNLFWMYAHATVYVMILPAIGIISEIITAFSRKRIFNYKYAVNTIFAIASFTLLSWGTHLLVSGQPAFATFLFSLFSLLLTIAFMAIILNWAATFYNASISFEAPMIFAYAFIGLFTIAAVSSLFLGMPSSAFTLEGTYFTVGYLHYLMVGGGVTAFLAAIHYWWPKITGRMYAEGWARIAAGVIFLGANMAFFPYLVLGFAGAPNRVNAYPINYQWLHQISMDGGVIMAIGLLIPGIYFIWSMFMGKQAGPNPWGVKGLEWQSTSPPPADNFKEQPTVSEEAYAYQAETV